MKRFVSKAVPAVLCAGVLVALTPAAMAQAKPKKAAPAVAQKTISGGAVKGNALTFNEYEACMKEQAALKTRTPELQRQRDAMEAERKAIQQDGEALKAQNETMANFSARVKAFNARLAVQGEKVKAWRARDEEIATGNRRGSAADQERKQLEADRQELQKTETELDQETKALEAERERLGVAGFNARATAQENAAIDWNARSKVLDKAFQAYEDDRVDWKNRCADRPYREEWEKILQNERK
jgi:predicted RNase H-like nuclease (RuvC/YqgF family)